MESWLIDILGYSLVIQSHVHTSVKSACTGSDTELEGDIRIEHKTDL